MFGDRMRPEDGPVGLSLNEPYRTPVTEPFIVAVPSGDDFHAVAGFATREAAEEYGLTVPNCCVFRAEDWDLLKK